MKIVIISDSHDNIPNIDKMLAYAKKEKVNTILHCGDVCSSKVLEYLAKKFKGEIYHVSGNVEGDHALSSKAKFKNINLLGNEGSPEIRGVPFRIGMVHYPNEAKEMAKTGKYNIIFYGHTHKPWIEKFENCQLVNPGTLSGLFQKATFAVWDPGSGKIELKILEIL